jgi:low affinity Fe/Cu permease
MRCAGPTDKETTMPGERREKTWFDSFASAVARWAGHAGAFAIAFAVVLFWALSGPIFGFSDTWQLVINTATTVLTFLMVFLIQNTLNRDSMALHLKLDELLRVTNEARDALIGAEQLSEREIQRLEHEEQLAAESSDPGRSGGSNSRTGS